MKLLALRHGLVALGLMAGVGCTVDADGPDDGYYEPGPVRDVPPISPSDVGADEVALTVEWTIDDSTDPDLCIQSAAAFAHVVIEDDVGVVDEAEVNCEDFVYDSPLLPPGTYWATVILRDEFGDPRTLPGETDARDLFEGDDYVVINFDRASFL
ncbi:MAG: hypothetical protein ABW321_18435 [Polyangiales bacterium]